MISDGNSSVEVLESSKSTVKELEVSFLLYCCSPNSPLFSEQAVGKDSSLSWWAVGEDPPFFWWAVGEGLLFRWAVGEDPPFFWMAEGEDPPFFWWEVGLFQQEMGEDPLRWAVGDDSPFSWWAVGELITGTSPP